MLKLYSLLIKLGGGEHTSLLASSVTFHDNQIYLIGSTQMLWISQYTFFLRHGILQVNANAKGIVTQDLQEWFANAEHISTLHESFTVNLMM